MFRLANLFVLALVLWSVGVNPVDAEYRYTVLGRAVSESGQPVPFARIVIVPGRTNKGGDFIYQGSADEQGLIRFEVSDSTLAEPTRVIYVTGQQPFEAVTLIEPPFDDYPLIGRAYGPRQIVIRKNGEVDLGDIPVRVFYHPVTIALKDRFDRPLITDAESWRYVWLRIRDEQGKLIEETSISIEQIERAVNLADSSVIVALPEGRWRFEISPNEGEKWLTSRKAIQIAQQDDPKRITLRTN